MDSKAQYLLSSDSKLMTRPKTQRCGREEKAEEEEKHKTAALRSTNDMLEIRTKLWSTKSVGEKGWGSGVLVGYGWKQISTNHMW